MARIDSGKNQENNDGSWEKMYKDFFDKFDSVHKSTGEALGKIGEKISKEAMTPFDYMQKAIEEMERIGSSLKAVQWALDQLNIKEYQDVLLAKGVTLRPASFYLGLIRKESSFNQQSESNSEGEKDKDGNVSQSRGLFQILVKTDSEGRTSSNTVDEVNKFYGLESKPEDVYFRGDDAGGREIAAQNNALVGILSWHRCYDHGKNLKPDWSEDDKDKLANMIYNMGISGVENISGAMGMVNRNEKAPKNFRELMVKIAKKLHEAYPAGLQYKEEVVVDPVSGASYTSYVKIDNNFDVANKTIKLGEKNVEVRAILEAMGYSEKVFSMNHVQPQQKAPATLPQVPEPEYVPQKPAPVEQNEERETLGWNKEIVLTFDDSLRDSWDIIQHLEEKGVTDYRFFAEFATALKPSVLKDMGIVNNQRSNKLRPGKWLTEYIDRKRGTMSRTDYIRKYMIKNESDQNSTNYLSMGANIKAKFQQLYPTNWMDKLQETFAYHAAILHPLNTNDHKNHIQYWTPEQIKEDIATFEEFMKAWLDVPDFKVRYLRPPVGGGFGFDKAWKGNGGIGNAAKLVNVLKEFRPDAKWQLWNVDTEDTRKKDGNIDSAAVAKRAVDNPARTNFHPYEPRGKTIVLMHTKYYGVENAARLDDLVDEIDTRYKERGAKKAVPKKVERVENPEINPEGIPSYEETVSSMEKVEQKYRHYFSDADKQFVFNTIEKFKRDLVDQNKDQYMVVVDRAKQFSALVYFSAEEGKYKIVGNFGAMTSTGSQKPDVKSWATPMGAYNLQPFIDKRVAEGKTEWRTEGTGGAGFGPKGSRVFHLGYVDVNSKWGKNASIAMHKTSRAGQADLGKTTKSHGCIRVADGFIDLLGEKRLIDSEYGHHVIVGDSSTNNKPKYVDLDHGRREPKQS